MNAIKYADFLKSQINKLLLFDSVLESKIMQKFRLDWNFHSNHLEDISLPMEKKSTFFNITVN
jgi:hypothetical protein